MAPSNSLLPVFVVSVFISFEIIWVFRVLVGGTPVHLDVQMLKRGVHIVVGTAGRICQMVQNGNLSMNCIDLFILDEADKLMEECFQKDIK